MIFAVQVATGKEAEFVKTAENELSAALRPQKFINLTRKLRIMRKGKWLEETYPLFPGYVFLEQDKKISAEQLRLFKNMRLFFQFLKSNREITPLKEEDCEILKRFLNCGGEIGTSRVRFNENDKIVVVSGPMMGLEGNIVKVNRRKQRAKIAISFNDTDFFLDLSYEVIEKQN